MSAGDPSSQRVRIVRLIPVLDFGGVESRFVLQSELMDRERFDLRVCTFWKRGQAARRIEALGHQVDELGVDPSIRNPRATWELVRYLRQVRPHVLHASVGEAMIHGAVAGRIAQVPSVIIEEVGIAKRSRAGRAAAWAAGQLAHVIVGVSQQTCDVLADNDGMPRSRIRLIYNCGKPEYFAPVTRSYRGPDLPLRVLTAGRLVPEKNQLQLLRAFQRLRQNNVAATLDIAGEGPLRPQLEAAIVELGLSDSVRLLGFRNDVRELLADCDVFVLSSVSEGCSIALVEAMATGTPVIGSNIPGIVEVMGPLGRDYIREPMDAAGWAEALAGMARKSEADRRELGQRAREIAEHGFAPERYIRALSDLYAGLKSRQAA